MKTKSKNIRKKISDLKPKKDAKGGRKAGGTQQEYGGQTPNGGATNLQMYGSNFQHNETLVNDGRD